MAFLVLPMPGQGVPLSTKIDKKKGEVEHAKRKEGVLSSDIEGFDNRINGLEGQISSLQSRQNRAQATLDQKRAELLKVRDKLERAKDRLARMKQRLAAGQKALAARLVEIYKADEPDALTVVLESDGFADLLERADTLERISEQDHDVVTRVRRLKKEAKKQERVLAKLESQAHDAANVVLTKRNEIASAKQGVLATRGNLADTRDGRREILAQVRDGRQEAQEDLASLQKEQARVSGSLQSQSGSAPDGPIKKGSGSWIWPVNGPITSPFCEVRSYEACHPGIDIGLPTGTPIHAPDAGRVAIASFTGGYGNYTCIQHSSSLSSCYGHQSAIKVSVGQNVRQGQVIGLVGSTGHSTGPHLHFEARVNGSVVNPLNYL